MARTDDKNCLTALPNTPAFQYRFFCQLFDDMIIMNMCVLRRGELKNRGTFSCTGCSKDRIMTATDKRSASLKAGRTS